MASETPPVEAKPPVLGRDPVLREFAPLTSVMDLIPHKAQRGLKTEAIQLTCFDATRELLGFGSNIGLVFLYERKHKQMQRLNCELKNDPISSVRLLSCLDDMVAVGTESGLVVVFQLGSNVPGHSKKHQKFTIEDQHEAAVVCTEWSANGMKLFSGDKAGKVVFTAVDFYEGVCRPTVLITEPSPVVQLHYLHKTLLVSTHQRTLLCYTDQDCKIQQVGQKPRKSVGPYGACFVPGMCNPRDVTLYGARPGLRLWRANIYGVVASTHVFKELMNATHPRIKLLDNTRTGKPPSDQQFGLLYVINDQQLVSWHNGGLLVVDPVENLIVGSCYFRKPVLNIACTEEEIFVLTEDREAIRIAMKPETARLDYSKLPTKSKQPYNTRTGQVDRPHTPTQLFNTASKTVGVFFHSSLLTKKKSTSTENLSDNAGREEKKLVRSGSPLTHLIKSPKSLFRRRSEGQQPGQDVVEGEQDIPAVLSPAIQAHISSEPTDSPPAVPVHRPKAVLAEISDQVTEDDSEGKDSKGHSVQFAREAEVLTPDSRCRSLLESAEQHLASASEADESNLDDDNAGVHDDTESLTKDVEEMARISASLSEKNRQMRTDFLEKLEKINQEGCDDIVFQPKTRKKKKKTKQGKAQRDLDTLSESQSEQDLSTVHQDKPGLYKSTYSQDSNSPPGSPTSTRPPGVRREDTQSSVSSAAEATEAYFASNETSMTDLDKVLHSSSYSIQETNEAAPAESCDSEPTNQAANVEVLGDKEEKEEEKEKSSESSEQTTVQDAVTSPAGEDDSLNVYVGSDDSEEPYFSHMEKDNKYPDSGLQAEIADGESTAGSTDFAKMQKDRANSTVKVIREAGVMPQSVMPQSEGTDFSTDDVDDVDIYGRGVARSPSTFSDLSSKSSVTTPMSEGSSWQENDSEPPTLLTVPSGQPKVADSWMQYTVPTQITSLSVSDRHIWVVDNKERIYYSPIMGASLSWKKLEQPGKLISVSSTGNILWRVHGKNNVAYACAKTTHKTPFGSRWYEAATDVLFMCVDSAAAWVIRSNGLFVQKNLSQDRPCSKMERVSARKDLVQVAACNHVVWVLTNEGKVLVRTGITQQHPEGSAWIEDKQSETDAISITQLALGDKNLAWAVDSSGQMWFRTGVTMETPMGDEGRWWQVSMSEYLITDPSMLESVLTLVETHNPLVDKVSAWLKGHTAHLVSANSSGVWVASGKNNLHVSRGNLTGTMWRAAPPVGLPQSTCWTVVAAGAGAAPIGLLWALQRNGEVFCFPPDSRKPTMIRPPPDVYLQYMSSSKEAVWALSNSGILYIRDAISMHCPQGARWADLDLSQLGDVQIGYVSCGTECVWVCDTQGNIYFRLGAKPPSTTCLNPAWIPIEGKPQLDRPFPTFTLVSEKGLGTYFTQVECGPSDWLVWAVDNRKNVYVRKDVTSQLPIGTSWELVPGTPAQQLCISNTAVWALCPNGDIACRYGISQNNPMGDYWKKVPGNFDFISVTPDDELWAINKDGHIYQRFIKAVMRQQEAPQGAQAGTADDITDDWEML
ncbi:tectonin beta-propeller repeat-containing protein 2-like isoform X1 [Branchiostoma floridae x Branchiostoma japonicum]